MRLLIVCENFTFGGLETQIASSIRFLTSQGIEVFLSTSPGFNARLLPVISEEPLELNYLAADGAEIAANARILSQYIRDRAVEVVHLHPFHSFWSGYLAAVDSGRPYACTLHGPWAFSPTYGLPFHLFQKHYVLPGSGATFVVSPEMGRLLEQSGMRSGGPVVTLPNAVDTDHFAPSNPTEAPIAQMAMISRLDRTKAPGVRAWLALCRRLMELHPSLGCVVAGDGSERRTLELDADSQGLSGRIRFIGNTNDIRGLLARSVLAAGMGRVVLEAASMNVPVVLVGYDEVKLMADGQNFADLGSSNFSGRGIPALDTETLIRQIEDSIHGAQRHRLRDQVLAGWDLEKTGMTYLDTLRRIVKTGTPYADEVRAAARSLEERLVDPEVSISAETALFKIFPESLLSGPLPRWEVGEFLRQFSLQRIGDWEKAAESTEQNLAQARERLAAETAAHGLTHKRLIAASRDLAEECEAHAQTHAALIAAGEALTHESEQVRLEREAHQRSHLELLVRGEELADAGLQLAGERQLHATTRRQLLDLGDELLQERSQLGREQQLHEVTRGQLVALSGELLQTVQELSVERRRAEDESQAKHRLYQQLLSVGDELRDERERLGAERGAHSETFRALQQIYSSRGWVWLERYRKFRRILREGTTIERARYAGHAAMRVAAAFRSRRSGPGDPATGSRAPAAAATAELALRVDTSTSVGEGVRILKEIVDSHPNVRGVVVYPPTLDWRYPLFQRPHHVALGLASRNYLFLYLSPNLHDRLEGAAKVADRLFVLNIPPESLAELPAVRTILYISWAATYPYVDLVPHRVLVYDYLDAVDLSDKPGEKNLALHRAALRKAQIVLATAGSLFDDARKTVSRVVLCPNAVDFDHFNNVEAPVPPDLQRVLDKGKPVVGYYGALAAWFDYPLVRTCAETHPEWEFVLIGLDHDGSLRKSGIESVPNVSCLGSREYRTLPLYLQGFTIATIPFLVTTTTVSTNPIKLFEYMAAGKPVVTTALPECRGYKAVFWSEDRRAYLENLAKAVAVAGSESRRALAIKESSDNTWDRRTDQIVAELTRWGF